MGFADRRDDQRVGGLINLIDMSNPPISDAICRQTRCLEQKIEDLAKTPARIKCTLQDLSCVVGH